MNPQENAHRIQTIQTIEKMRGRLTWAVPVWSSSCRIHRRSPVGRKNAMDLKFGGPGVCETIPGGGGDVPLDRGRNIRIYLYIYIFLVGG